MTSSATWYLKDSQTLATIRIQCPSGESIRCVCVFVGCVHCVYLLSGWGLTKHVTCCHCIPKIAMTSFMTRNITFSMDIFRGAQLSQHMNEVYFMVIVEIRLWTWKSFNKSVEIGGNYYEHLHQQKVGVKTMVLMLKSSTGKETWISN